MAKARVIIADTDLNYMIPLQLKFAEEFFDEIDLEIISSKSYFDTLFAAPQVVDVLIVSEELYNSALRRHTIGAIFLMTELPDDGMTGELDIHRMYKYTSVYEIYAEIIGKCGNVLRKASMLQASPKIVLVYSACGGVGKTTLAMGISASLTRNRKNVLYINADWLQSFRHFLADPAPITDALIYSDLARGGRQAFPAVSRAVRRESFHYLPPFKAALFSLGLDYGVYEQIAEAAKASGEYDYIVVDADASLSEAKAQLIDIADKVVVVTDQSERSIHATNALMANIAGTSGDKYIFVCNGFSTDRENALTAPDMKLRFHVNAYVGQLPQTSLRSCDELAKQRDIQKLTLLVI